MTWPWTKPWTCLSFHVLSCLISKSSTRRFRKAIFSSRKIFLEWLGETRWDTVRHGESVCPSVIGNCTSPSLTLEADCAQPAPATEEACFESFCNWTAGSPAVKVSKAFASQAEKWAVASHCVLSQSDPQQILFWVATFKFCFARRGDGVGGLQCHPGCFDAIVSKMVTIYDAGFGVSGSRENDMPQLDSISKATCGPGFQLREVLCPVFALSPIAYGDICKRKTLIALQDRPDCMFVSDMFTVFTLDLSIRLVRVTVRALPVFKLAPNPESEIINLQLGKL